MYAKKFEIISQKKLSHSNIQTTRYTAAEPDTIFFKNFKIIKHFFSEPGPDAPKVEIVNYKFFFAGARLLNLP